MLCLNVTYVVLFDKQFFICTKLKYKCVHTSCEWTTCKSFSSSSIFSLSFLSYYSYRAVRWDCNPADYSFEYQTGAKQHYERQTHPPREEILSLRWDDLRGAWRQRITFQGPLNFNWRIWKWRSQVAVPSWWLVGIMLFSAVLTDEWWALSLRISQDQLSLCRQLKHIHKYRTIWTFSINDHLCFLMRLWRVYDLKFGASLIMDIHIMNNTLLINHSLMLHRSVLS